MSESHFDFQRPDELSLVEIFQRPMPGKTSWVYASDEEAQEFTNMGRLLCEDHRRGAKIHEGGGVYVRRLSSPDAGEFEVVYNPERVGGFDSTEADRSPVLIRHTHEPLEMDIINEPANIIRMFKRVLKYMGRRTTIVDTYFLRDVHDEEGISFIEIQRKITRGKKAGMGTQPALGEDIDTVLDQLAVALAHEEGLGNYLPETLFPIPPKH